MFIYVIVNSETLKIYIGQHKGKNLRKYLQTKFSDARKNRGGSSHLYASMRKHPKEVWSIHPLMQHSTKDDLDYWEMHFIRVLKTQHPDVGYNISPGGEGLSYWLGKSRDAKTKVKISVSQRGHPGNTGSFMPGAIPWNAGKPGAQVAWNKGKPMPYRSAESRMRAMQNLNWKGKKRKPFSAEHRAALSAARRKANS